jgi:hypothetical protein
VRAVAARTLLLSSLLLASLALAAPSGAGLIGGGPPNPGLGGDDGTELYLANLNPVFNQHIVLVKEAFDGVLSTVPHEWGFYFASDPTTLYPVLTATDQGPPEQAAVIDFDNGRVVDLDSLSIESTFTPSLDAFGFYLEIELNPGSPVRLFSEAALNDGGIDSFASFPFLANPLFRMVAFEAREQLYSLEIVDGAIPVPEPTTIALLAGGVAILAARRRA